MSACVAGEHCAAFDSATKEPADAFAAPLCDECLRVAAADVAALRFDYDDLGRELAPAEQGMSRRVACGDDDDTVPLALHIEALQRSIFWALTVWEPPVREAAGLTRERTRGVRDRWAVDTAVTVIAPRVVVLARLGPTWGYAEGLDAGPVARDGVWALSNLRALHRRARAACGVNRWTFTLPGECSRCGAAALLRRDGSDTVWCGACDQRWTYDDYRRYVGLMLAESR